MRKPPIAYSLIETMRAEPGAGIVRASLHMTRLRNSARKLGFAGSEIAWDAMLARAFEIRSTHRLRLELFSDGRFEITATPFAPLSAGTVWRVAIARQARLQSRQPLVRHKTSARQTYDAARGEFNREAADEVILLNETGEICEGTITNIFVEGDDGRLLTPPLSSGCLAGVLRSALLCSKKARTAKLMPQDLTQGRIFVGNSLRGLIPAALTNGECGS